MRTFKFEKKHIFAAVLAIACIVIGILCAIKAVDSIKYNEFLVESSLLNLRQTNLIADGGNGTEIPKNTKYAIDDLVVKQFKSIKIDARLTADKKFVSLKNNDISDFTNGKGNVGNYRYYDLLNYNLKNFKPSEFPSVELVSDTASYAYRNGVSPIIYFHEFNKESAKELLAFFYNEGVTVSAFASDNIKVLRYIRKINNSTHLIYYIDVVTDEAIEFCKEDKNTSLCFNAKNKQNTATAIEKMTTEEVDFLCYGTESLKDIEKLYKIGVRSFITDTVRIDKI